MVRPIFIRVGFLFLMWVMSGFAGAESLTATVDRAQIGENETLTLKVRFEGGQAQSSPDFSSLREHFDILSNRQSSQHSNINGEVSVATEWVLMLAPKMTGEILIAPFQVHGQQSAPLSIQVSKAPAKGGATQQDVFVTLEADKQKVFINEQLTLTFTLYYNQTVESLDKPALNIDQARVTELERLDYQTVIDNTRYGVAQYRYLVFPDATGTIVIDPQTWTVRTTDQPNVGRFFASGRTKLYRPKTDELKVAVNPKPNDYPATAAWLPASSVKLEERWSRQPDPLQLGEPITWTLTIAATGVSSEQLPPLLTQLQPNGFKVYPDQPHHETRTTTDGLISVRTESVAIVPNDAGEVMLPAVELQWWDTDTQEVKLASLPARTLKVIGAPAGSAPSTVTDASTPVPGTDIGSTEVIEYRTPPIMLAVLALLVLTNLAWLGLWWRQRAHTASAEGPTAAAPLSKSYKSLLHACEHGTAPEIRKALLEWAREYWPCERPLTLDDLVARCEDPAHARCLQRLDVSLYSKAHEQTELDRLELRKAVAHLNRQSASNPTVGDLRPLYAS